MDAVLFACLALVALMVGIAVVAAALAWQPRPTVTATRPASSNRKSGRTRAES